MKLLVCAEGYGFGPVSKAVSIVKLLREQQPKLDAVFYGEGTANDFATNNAELFSKIIDSRERSIEDVLSSVSPSVVLSSMEPEPIVKAKLLDDPPFTALVDSLFWYWRTDSTELEEHISSDQKLESVSQDSDTTNFHEFMLYTHTTSDISYVQSFPSKRSDGLSPNKFNTMKTVGPIIDTHHSGDGPPRLIISFAGMLSPVVSVDQAVMYANLVLEELSTVLSEFDDAGFHPLIVGNEQVLQRLNTAYETDFLSHNQYLEILDAAPILICPASIMSIYEATAYEVPVVLLPELSPSHWPDYSGLNKGVEGTPFDGAILGEEVEELQDIPDAEIDRLYELLSEYRADRSVFDGAVDQAFRSAESQLIDLLQEKNRKELAFQQCRTIEERLPSSNGAQQIASDLLSRVG